MTSQLVIRYRRRLLIVTLYSIAMGFAEAAVVVYLRLLYYPDGFSFPIRDIPDIVIGVELGREFATVLMLIAVAGLAAKRFWERFGFFIISFGIWDIFYYIILKLVLDWPGSIFDWDVLFLIPIPWIGPVIAPVIVSVIMIISGILITRLFMHEIPFKPTMVSWLLGLAGIIAILYTFMRDTDATIRMEMPEPYWYWLFIFGAGLSVFSFILSYKRAIKKTKK